MTHTHKFLWVIGVLSITSSTQVFSQAANCDALTPGLIPLTDLCADFYCGFQGGLCPGGANTEDPMSKHYKKGRSFAKNMQPLDSLGNINYEGGVVLMGGFGPSVPAQILDEFVPMVRDNTDSVYLTNICFDAINMGAGGKGLEYAIGEDSTKYWNNMLNKVEEKGYTAAQLQVGWMYFSDKHDSTDEITFPTDVIELKNDLIFWLKMCKQKFPNMKIMFVSGRHYGGFCDPLLEQYPAISEPASYYNNWAVKWMIQDQIENKPPVRYLGLAAVVPFITWGPYYWTNGAEPRVTDGRSYPCELFSEEDGYHLVHDVYEDEADYLLNHIYYSEFGKYYVQDGLKWFGCVPYHEKLQQDNIVINENGISLYPNPATDMINIYRYHTEGEIYAIEIYNETGTLVYRETSGGDNRNTIPEDIEDLPGGIYVMRVQEADHWMSERFIKQ